jgi:hypothetical protein
MATANMSILARLKQDGTNAFADAYSSFVLGDDAGKSARIALVLQPQKSQFLHLGMTFLEINGRAYVRTVDPNSEAGLAGIMPRDAVQFAAVYKLEWSNNGDSAKEYALDCDSKGMRISYDELRRMLRDGLDPHHSSFLSPESRWKGPPIPSSINVCVPMVEEDARPLSPFSSDRPKPVVFVFRRTRQRPNTLWNFRLDDECDFASSLIRRLAPTADMDMPSPDTWEGYWAMDRFYHPRMAVGINNRKRNKKTRISRMMIMNERVPQNWLICDLAWQPRHSNAIVRKMWKQPLFEG